MDPTKATDKHLEFEVQITAITDMSSFSAGTLVSSWSLRQPATLQTLRFEASLNLTFDEDIQIERTRTVDLCTNLGCWICSVRGW